MDPEIEIAHASIIAHCRRIGAAPHSLAWPVRGSYGLLLTCAFPSTQCFYSKRAAGGPGKLYTPATEALEWVPISTYFSLKAWTAWMDLSMAPHRQIECGSMVAVLPHQDFTRRMRIYGIELFGKLCEWQFLEKFKKQAAQSATRCARLCTMSFSSVYPDGRRLWARAVYPRHFRAEMCSYER